MLIDEIRKKIKALLEARATSEAELQATVKAAEERGDGTLSEEEETALTAARAAIVKNDEERAELEKHLAELDEDEKRQKAADESRSKVEKDAPRVVVTTNEEIYRSGGAHSFFADAYAMRYLGDSGAAQRIGQHQAGAEVRDVGTPQFVGLTIPQFLIDLAAPLARAGRPIANACRKLTLPPAGMTLNISRITTGTATAIQATENAAVQETDIDDTNLVVNVRTIAGQQDVSRQSLERSEDVDQVVMGDLVSAYHTNLDNQIINADGTSGTHLGILATVGIEAVTYTDATPTVAEFYPKLADAVQRVNSNRFLPATVIFMHPRRWGWLMAAVDSTGRPFVVPNQSGPMNAAGVGEAAGYGQVVGTILGIPVVTDANLPTSLGTNEDIIIVVRAEDLLLWEEGDGSPRFLRFEETLGGNLTVKMVVYGYSAFAAGRYPKAVATVGGSGLILPVF